MSNSEVLPGGDQLIGRIRSQASGEGVARIRFALGYLFVPGLLPLWDALEASTATEIHLLIGNTAGILTDEQRIASVDAIVPASPTSSVAPEYDMAAGARADRDAIIRETAEALRENLRQFSGNVECAPFLRRLAGAIGANRLRVRIYPEGRLHSKASLFEYARKNSGSGGEQSVAVVGASNLSLPGEGNPTEINVLLRGAEEVAAVSQWFEALWNVSQDFTRAFFVELTQPATTDALRV